MKHLPLILAIALLGAAAYVLTKSDPPKRPVRAESPESPSPESPPAVKENNEPGIKPEVEIDHSKFWSTAVSREPSPGYQPANPAHDYYSAGKKTRDGTGKYYQGREISQVMGHPALTWLERSNREDEESPSKAMELLGLGENEVLADIGAGSGYYSLRLAMQRPKGWIVAVDIQPEMLDFLEKRKEQLDVPNISPHLGKIDNVGLPAESIDSALMVDAYHEFSHPYEMMTSIVSALRPGGRVFLLEYRGEDPTVPIKPLHKMTQAQVKKEMALVGLTWEKTHDDLPWQHLMVFRKP